MLRNLAYGPAVGNLGAYVALPSRNTSHISRGGDESCGEAVGDIGDVAGIGISDDTCCSRTTDTYVGHWTHDTHVGNLCDITSFGMTYQTSDIAGTLHGTAGINKQVMQTSLFYCTEESCHISTFHYHVADGVASAVHVTREWIGIVTYGSPVLTREVYIAGQSEIHAGSGP